MHISDDRFLRGPVTFCVASTLLLPALAVAQQHQIFDLRGEANGDHFGWSVREAGDVTQDGYADFVVGAPYADFAGIDSGRAYVISGRTGVVVYAIDGQSRLDSYGLAVSGAGDVNRDGFPDVIIGAPGPMRSSTIAGYAEVRSGANGALLRRIDGSAVGDRFGAAVSAAGFVNSDGFPDVVVGAPGDEQAPHINGYAWVISGGNGSIIHNLTGSGLHDAFGSSVSGIGDINGDGKGELAVGAPLADGAASDSGIAWIFDGQSGAPMQQYSGADESAELGYRVRNGGDVNSDGVGDLLIGARFEESRGSVYAISGSNLLTIRRQPSQQLFTWFGSAVASAGDVNGDGFADYLVGAPIHGVTPGSPQAVPITGSVTILSGADGVELLEIVGSMDMGWTGWAASGAGDVNGDGDPDFLVGSPLFDRGKGRVRLLSSSALALTTNVHTLSTTFGGTQAFMIDAGPTQAGRIYLVLGSASGTQPGFSVGVVPVPLNPDGWTLSTISMPNQFPFTNTLGTLDAQGRAVAGFTIPPAVLGVLNGLTFHHAFILWQEGTFLQSSNAVPLTFQS